MSQVIYSIVQLLCGFCLVKSQVSVEILDSIATLTPDGLQEAELSLIFVALPFQLLNEFEPNPFGSDLVTQSIEIKGIPGSSFVGCVVLVDCDTNSLAADSAVAVSGTFDSDGILVVSVNDLKNPSFILLLVAGGCPTLGTPSGLTSSNVVDAIGIPASSVDVAFCQPSEIDPSLSIFPSFAYTGDEPKLVFRDRVTNAWYAINDPPLDEVIDIDGNSIATSAFLQGDPLQTSFGALNPTTSLFTAQINEFEPNPFGADPPNQPIELLGFPFSTFFGCIVAVDCDDDNLIIDKASAVTGMFDRNGLLVVSISDLENPSFILMLLNGDNCPPLGADSTMAINPTNVIDAIGIPDSTFDEDRCKPTSINPALDIFPGFTYTGDQPKLVFRDGATRVWYALNDPPLGVVIRQDGLSLVQSDFATGNPFLSSFGQTNPSVDIIIHPPTAEPSNSNSPSIMPSLSPSSSSMPSPTPSEKPSIFPSFSHEPTLAPSSSPSFSTKPSLSPSVSASLSMNPSNSPSNTPSLSPKPSTMPSLSPSSSLLLTSAPSDTPSLSSEPSMTPSATPSHSITPSTSMGPTFFPSTSTLPTVNENVCTESDRDDPIIYCPDDIVTDIGQLDDCTSSIHYEIFSEDECVMKSLTRIVGKNSNKFRATHGRIDLTSTLDAPVGRMTHTFIAMDAAGRSTSCSFDVSVTYPISCHIKAPGDCIHGTESCTFDPDVGEENCAFVCSEVATSYLVSWSYPVKTCYDQPLTVEAIVKAGCLRDLVLTESDNNGEINLSQTELMKCKHSGRDSEDFKEYQEEEVKLIVTLKAGGTIVGICEDSPDFFPESNDNEVGRLSVEAGDTSRMRYLFLVSSVLVGTILFVLRFTMFKQRQCCCVQKGGYDDDVGDCSTNSDL